MTWALANATKSAAANGATATSNSGTLKLYTGTRPATPDTAITTQTLLVTLGLAATAFGAAVNGVATANAISSGSAVAAGVATWGRAFSSGGAAVGDCDVSATGGGGDVTLPSATLAIGELVSGSSLTWTQP